MKSVRIKLVAFSAIIVSLGAIGFGWHMMADAEREETNPASILAVRAHPLTPSQIITVAEVADRGTCAASVVSFQSDSLKEYALALKPPVAPPVGGYPVIIFAHGYTNPRTYKTDNTQYQKIVTWYCEHDYLVFKPDYRGHGASAGIPVNGLYSPSDTYDVLNLAASLPSYKLANANRIMLVGHSMGGGVVLRANVASHNLPFKAVVTMAGAVASLPDLTYHWGGRVPPDVAAVRSQVMRREGPPNQTPGYWHDGSAINYLVGEKAPVQIDQGLADASVPASFAAGLDRALWADHLQHQYYTYAGTDHLFSNPQSLALFLSRSTSFMNANNK